jgi:cell division protein ZapD
MNLMLRTPSASNQFDKPINTAWLSKLNDLVFYEFPLHERIRVFMRLELLFQQIDYFMQGDTVWDSRAVISSLIEVLTVFTRNDLKSEIIKEVDRHSSVLGKMRSNPNIDSIKLDGLLAKLEQISTELYGHSGKIGHSLMESDLFKSISQRSAIPGGTCAFDLPAYHFWLEKADSQRRSDLESWLEIFKTVRTALTLLLNFIRHSAAPTQELAQAGFFQQTLDHSLPYQLLRVGLMRSQPYFAEISGGKHRFTVRFMTAGTSERPTQAYEDIPFELTRCIF